MEEEEEEEKIPKPILLLLNFFLLFTIAVASAIFFLPTVQCGLRKEGGQIGLEDRRGVKKGASLAREQEKEGKKWEEGKWKGRKL